MVTALPKCTAAILAPVVVTSQLSGGSLHQPSDFAGILGSDDQMNVIGGDIVSE